jgi:hypothetical protein
MLLTHVVCAGGLRLRYVGSAAILRVVASSLLSAVAVGQRFHRDDELTVSSNGSAAG